MRIEGMKPLPLRDDVLWTIRDLSVYSRQSQAKIARDVRLGRLPYVRLGTDGRARFRPQEIKAWLEAHSVKPGAKT